MKVLLWCLFVTHSHWYCVFVQRSWISKCYYTQVKMWDCNGAAKTQIFALSFVLIPSALVFINCEIVMVVVFPGRIAKMTKIKWVNMKEAFSLGPNICGYWFINSKLIITVLSLNKSQNCGSTLFISANCNRNWSNYFNPPMLSIAYVL